MQSIRSLAAGFGRSIVRALCLHRRLSVTVGVVLLLFVLFKLVVPAGLPIREIPFFLVATEWEEYGPGRKELLHVRYSEWELRGRNHQVWVLDENRAKVLAGGYVDWGGPILGPDFSYFLQWNAPDSFVVSYYDTHVADRPEWKLSEMVHEFFVKDGRSWRFVGREITEPPLHTRRATTTAK